MPDLLLELFSEEIPARMQARAAEDLRKAVTDRLVGAGLVYDGAKAFVTPRRLTLAVHGVPVRQPDAREEKKGPRVGAPDNAVAGFLKAAGLKSIGEAKIQPDKKGDFYVAVIEKPGRAAIEVIGEILPDVIKGFPWPKSMRWGERSGRPGALQWVRPLHSIVATFGIETEELRRLTDLALFGSMLAAPATDLIPPGVAGHVTRALPAYDPAAARRSLDLAGFQGEINLYFSTNSTVGRVGRDLQDQLMTVTGRTVNLHPIGDFFRRASLDELPLFIDTWTADYPYPSDVLENLLRSNAQFNNVAISDPQVDAALDQGKNALTFESAIKAYQQAESIALNENRLIPLYSGVEQYLVRPGITVPFAGGSLAYRWEDVR